MAKENAKSEYHAHTGTIYWCPCCRIRHLLQSEVFQRTAVECEEHNTRNFTQCDICNLFVERQSWWVGRKRCADCESL